MGRHDNAGNKRSCGFVAAHPRCKLRIRTSNVAAAQSLLPAHSPWRWPRRRRSCRILHVPTVLGIPSTIVNERGYSGSRPRSRLSGLPCTWPLEAIFECAAHASPGSLDEQPCHSPCRCLLGSQPPTDITVVVISAVALPTRFAASTALMWRRIRAGDLASRTKASCDRRQTGLETSTMSAECAIGH